MRGLRAAVRRRCNPLAKARSNWTLDTANSLLIGIAGEEIQPASESLLDRPPRNYLRAEWLKQQQTMTSAGEFTFCSNSDGSK